MKKCPRCDYLLDAFDPTCPRCQGKGIQPPPPAARPTPSAVERLKKEALTTPTTSETAGGSMRGALLALLPALVTLFAFSALMAINDPSSPDPFSHPNSNPFDHPLRGFSLAYFLLFLPPCLLCGAGIGAWIGSSFPVQDIKKGALGGVVIALAFAVTTTALIHFQLQSLGVSLLLVQFLGVILCGAYGGAERQRNEHGDNDGNLFALLGIGIFTACLPLIGLFLTIVLTRSGSDKANAALGGTVLGFVFQGVLLVATLASLH